MDHSGIDKDQLFPISIDALKVGMVIDYEIYYKNDDKFVLLCKDLELTIPILLKLKRNLSNNRNIYIEHNIREKLLSESDYVKKMQNKLEIYIGYNNVKEKVSVMIDEISQNQLVSMDFVDNVAEELNKKLNTFDQFLIIQCLNGIREADEYLYTHSINVAMLNGLIARWLKLPENAVMELIEVGLLHDIGKLQIPDEILNKPSKLTDSEFEIMKMHSLFGYEILHNSVNISDAIMIGVQQHHEKMNGNGYPFGLNADDISYYARVTAVSDVYDAMVGKRVYKAAHSPFEILQEFSKGRFSDLDIEIVNVFLQNMPSEFIGKLVMLSDGSIGKVMYVDANQFEFPMVEVDGNVIKTSPQLRCLSMYFDS